MKIMNVNSKLLTSGMVLYEDVFNSSGAVILNKGTILNNNHIEKLYLNQIDKVKIKIVEDADSPEQELPSINYVYNKEKMERFKHKYTDNVDEVTRIIKEIGKGAFVDIRSINEISRHILHDFDTLGDVINYMHLVSPLYDYTYSHSLNVSLISIIIAKWLNFNESEINDIATAGLLHDLGKTRISQELLSKPGKLTTNEFEEVKKHTVFGFMMLENVKDVTKTIKHSVLMHHEKIDGTGYPLGINNEQIPMIAKIVAIADIYDAMTSNRSYREKMCPFEVIKSFEVNTFGKLDTMVLTVFLKNIANSYIGDFVELNNGEIAEIVFINPNRVWQPIVKSGKEYIDLSERKGTVFIKQIL